MEQIEDKLTKVLPPLLLGEPATLNNRAQSTIAKWAVMASIVAEYDDEPRRTTPKSDRDYFYEEKQPPPGWKVWIGTKRSGVLDYHFAHLAALVVDTSNPNPVAPPEGDYNVQFSVFALGGVVILTCLNPLARTDYYFEGAMTQKMAQIYPPIKPTIDTSLLEILSGPELANLQRHFLIKNKKWPKRR